MVGVLVVEIVVAVVGGPVSNGTSDVKALDVIAMGGRVAYSVVVSLAVVVFITIAEVISNSVIGCVVCMSLDVILTDGSVAIIAVVSEIIDSTDDCVVVGDCTSDCPVVTEPSINFKSVDDCVVVCAVVSGTVVSAADCVVFGNTETESAFDDSATEVVAVLAACAITDADEIISSVFISRIKIISKNYGRTHMRTKVQDVTEVNKVHTKEERVRSDNSTIDG